MITSEHKNLCIQLYLEGGHTIKDIISETGLKNSSELYQILDEAGVPRKRKVAAKETAAEKIAIEEKVMEKITIEESRMRFLSSMCRLYKNEPANPYDEKDDAFKTYMWRNEWKILQNAQEEKFIQSEGLDDPRTWSKYFNSRIKAYIDLWTDKSKGENPRQWLSKYYNYKTN